MAGCHAGVPMAVSNSVWVASSSASASDHRPSSMSSDACTLAQWLLRNSGPPGVDPSRPRTRSGSAHEAARSKSVAK